MYLQTHRAYHIVLDTFVNKYRTGRAPSDDGGAPSDAGGGGSYLAFVLNYIAIVVTFPFKSLRAVEGDEL